ncbi:MAG TPA: hypothetical protein V6D50_08920 [Chroococcales cyanobacterium]
MTNDTKQFKAADEFNKILQPLLGDYSVIMVDGDCHDEESRSQNLYLTSLRFHSNSLSDRKH